MKHHRASRGQASLHTAPPGTDGGSAFSRNSTRTANEDAKRSRKKSHVNFDVAVHRDSLVDINFGASSSAASHEFLRKESGDRSMQK